MIIMTMMTLLCSPRVRVISTLALTSLSFKHKALDLLSKLTVILLPRRHMRVKSKANKTRTVIIKIKIKIKIKIIIIIIIIVKIIIIIELIIISLLL